MMNVTLELRPEIEKRVASEAAARGLTVEAYLPSVIEGGTLSVGADSATCEEFEADMDLLAKDSERLPVLEVMSSSGVQPRRSEKWSG